MSDDLVEMLTPKLIGNQPNTYTFSKCLAEYILVQEGKGLPLAIFRPSIVGASWKEPTPVSSHLAHHACAFTLLRMRVYSYFIAHAQLFIAHIVILLRMRTFTNQFICCYNVVKSFFVQGWVDNTNGPTGLILAVGKGFMRVMRVDMDRVADIIPVDTAVNMLIAVGWYTSTACPSQCLVYHCTTGGHNPCTWQQIGWLVFVRGRGWW